jgi:hypothetical protein
MDAGRRGNDRAAADFDRLLLGVGRTGVAQPVDQDTMNQIVPNENAAPVIRVLAVPLSQKFCSYCATRLDVHQAARGSICSDPACRKKQVLAEAKLRRETEAADVQRIAVEFRARMAPTLGVADPSSLALGVVPHFSRAVVKLPRARRMEFRAHLVRIVRQAFEEKLDTSDVSMLAEELSVAVQPPPEFPEGGPGCATCRGHCCRVAGTHAFLNATVVRSFLVRNPGMSQRAVVRAFLSQLPKMSFDYSCVYHGRHGCVLPREMRAGICNYYYCQGLQELRETLASSGRRPVLMVSIAGEKVGRAALLKPEGERVLVQKIRVGKP